MTQLNTDGQFYFHIGFIALILSAVGFAMCLYFKVQVSMVYDTFIGIITATILWSIIVAVIVYIMACQQKRGLAPGGNTGKQLIVMSNSYHLSEITLFHTSVSLIPYDMLKVYLNPNSQVKNQL